MDILGDAVEAADDWPQQSDQWGEEGTAGLLSPQTCAVASLALGFVSFLASWMTPMLGFLVGPVLESGDKGRWWDFLPFVAPTLLISALGAALGIRATRSVGSGSEWVRGLAGAGVIVCGVGLALAIAIITIGTMQSSPEPARF